MTKHLFWPVAAIILLTACPRTDDKPPAVPVWTESERRIYHDLPARVKFSLALPGQEEAARITAAAWSEFERLGTVFNPFDPATEVAKLNAMHKTAPVPVSDDLRDVLAMSELVHSASGGAFDPTLWPVKTLWMDAMKRQRAPSEHELAAAVAKTGLAKAHLGEGSLSCDDPSLQFDFGGISEGYAVDRVLQILRRRGAAAGLVQLGGETAAFGDNNGKPWVIGVAHPLEKLRLYGRIEARGAVRVSTSGNYQRSMVIGGRTYYRILDPKTGKPVPERVLGATVASFGDAPGSATIGAVAAAVAVLGPEKGLELAKKLGAEALVLYDEASGVRQAASAGLLDHFTRAEPKPQPKP